MKLLLIMVLAFTQEAMAGKISLLKDSTRRLLMSGRIFPSPASKEARTTWSDGYGGEITMPKISWQDYLSENVLSDIKKNQESIEEARQIVRTNHGDEALRKLEQMLN